MGQCHVSLSISFFVKASSILSSLGHCHNMFQKFTLTAADGPLRSMLLRGREEEIYLMPIFLEGQEPFELPPNIIQPCVGSGRGYLSFLWLFEEKSVMGNWMGGCRGVYLKIVIWAKMSLEMMCCWLHLEFTRFLHFNFCAHVLPVLMAKFICNFPREISPSWFCFDKCPPSRRQ